MNLDDNESPVNQPPLDNIRSRPSSPCHDEPQGNDDAMDTDDHRDSMPAPTTSTQQHQTVLSFNTSTPTAAPALVIAHPITTTTTAEKEGARCALCVQALCGLRFSCKGSVKRSWCTCNHPPVIGRKKVRWSEDEVKRRLTLRDVGPGQT
jgi:hypothetical protein